MNSTNQISSQQNKQKVGIRKENVEVALNIVKSIMLQSGTEVCRVMLMEYEKGCFWKDEMEEAVDGEKAFKKMVLQSKTLHNIQKEKKVFTKNATKQNSD